MQALMIKYVSFDIDKTLVKDSFDQFLWNEEIPKLYAKQNNISLERAKEYVFAEYYKALYIEFVDNWVDVTMWFTRLGLNEWEELLDDMKQHLDLFGDVMETLKDLSKDYELIVISANDARLLEIKLEAEGIASFFVRTFPTVTFAEAMKDNPRVYAKALMELGVQPEEILHIGDNFEKDYAVPKSLGINCLHLDRSKKTSGEHVIHSLREIKDKLKDF